MLQESTVPSVRQLYGDEDMYQQDGAIPHYHRDIRTYLDNTFPERWIGRRRSVEYPPVSPDLTPPDSFFLWGYLKDAVYSTKPAPSRNWTALHSGHSSKFHGRLSVSCSPLLTVPILNTCTRFANLLSDSADVCNGLIYWNVFLFHLLDVLSFADWLCIALSGSTERGGAYRRTGITCTFFEIEV